MSIELIFNPFSYAHTFSLSTHRSILLFHVQFDSIYARRMAWAMSMACQSSCHFELMSLVGWLISTILLILTNVFHQFKSNPISRITSTHFTSISITNRHSSYNSLCNVKKRVNYHHRFIYSVLIGVWFLPPFPVQKCFAPFDTGFE